MTRITNFDRRYALAVLVVVYGFNFLDRQILVILQEPIKAELGLQDIQLGLLTGFAFALFYVTAGIPIAWWADRGVRKNIIALAVAVWSSMTVLCGLAQNYLQLVAARIGVGIGEAGATPPAHAMISDYFEPKRRATALAIYTLGIYLGLAAGFAMGGYIGQHLGWRNAFLIAGLPGLLLALVVRFTVKEPPRGRWDRNDAPPVSRNILQSLQALRGNRAFWMLAAGCALANVVNYGASSFNPSFLIRSHELELAQTGFTLALVWSLSGMLGTFAGGRIADKLGQRDPRWYAWTCAIGQLLAWPFSVLTYLAPTLPLTLTAMFISHTLLVLMLGPTFAIGQSLVGPEMRAMASAVLLFLLNLIGLGFGPLLVGGLSDLLHDTTGVHSLRYGLLAVSVVSLPAAACYFVTARRLPEPVSSSDSR